MSIKRDLIYIDDIDKTSEIESYEVVDNKISVRFKNGKKSFLYGRRRVRIVKAVPTSDIANTIYSYIKELAEVVGLKDDEGSNLLADNFKKLDKIDKASVLNNYLNKTLDDSFEEDRSLYFPFGFNLSQRDAVTTAFSNKRTSRNGKDSDHS